MSVLRLTIKTQKLPQFMSFCRSSHQRCSVKKVVPRNAANFIGKQLCQSLFFYKVAGLLGCSCNFIKKETLTQVFSCEFCEISKNNFFPEHVWETASDSDVINLLLIIQSIFQLLIQSVSRWGWSIFTKE